MGDRSPERPTALSQDPGLTREDDGHYELPSATCVLIRFGSVHRVVEVRDHVEVVIGRSHDVTFVANDDRVSRRHARVVCRDGALYVSDLGSRNGTTLNGRRLTEEQLLGPGDEVLAGPVRITVYGPARIDPIATEGRLHERLHSEVERALRFSRPLSVVGLRLSGSPTHRREAALRVAGRLRRIDLLGEYAPGEYLAVLPEMERVSAAEWAQTLAGEARALVGVAASASAASVPASATTVEDLIHAAFDDEPAESTTVPNIVAEDPATREVFATARRAAKSDLTVLLIGETGTGKEVIAAEIHRSSTRAAGPYVCVNCASLPETLIESALFGHERGAFTGADKRHEGFLECASGGTLLFDEIGELPLALQAKLLRVVEERKLSRVGGTSEIPIDVRFLAATNRDLEREVKARRFRQDLFFRLSALTLHLPPLRDRALDIPQLAETFARSAAARAGRATPRLSPEFLAALRRYPWPGNVRELRNCIERALVLAEGATLSVDHLPERFSAFTDGKMALGTTSMRERVDDVERRALEDALQKSQGNRTHAARHLGISRRQLLYKIKKYGLE